MKKTRAIVLMIWAILLDEYSLTKILINKTKPKPINKNQIIDGIYIYHKEKLY